jgi:cytochrome c biogenesis protein CcdA
MAALRVPPLKLPRLARVSGHPRDSLTGIAGPAVAGLLMGGGVAACSLPCNPGIFIVLGAAVLQGHAVWGMVLMSAFAVGFGLPLSAILLGVSFGKASLGAQRAETAIRAVAGVLLVCAGFYLLATA